MDLAQAASIFKKSNNFKALGICYNNIANIQYKNAQYREAARNFAKAIKQVEKLMVDVNKYLKEGKKANESDTEYYLRQDGYLLEMDYLEKVRAHRMYQYAMSRYKLMRYTPEANKDQKLNWQIVDYELR